MNRSEVDMAIKLAAKEGWNPGLFDAECFYQTDPSGFLIGMLNNQPVGCISAVSYEGQTGFIGFYIVIPEFRDKGYGIRIWQAAIKKLTGQNMALDAVVAQEPTYIKAGFQRAYRNFRFEKPATRLPVPECPEIIKLQEISFEAVEQYDRQCFFAKRPQFLRCWLDMPSATALGYVEQGQLKGYGVIRQCYQGYKIGPLFADNQDIADILYLQLVSKVEEGEPVYLDVPEANPPSVALAGKYNMKEVFATARMYSRGEPDLSIEKVFGVTTFELG